MRRKTLLNSRSDNIIHKTQKYEDAETNQPYFETFQNNSRRMLLNKVEPLSRSIECKHSWRLNGVSYNNCTALAEPGMCFCATQVDDVTKELSQWKYCLKGECFI